MGSFQLSFNAIGTKWTIDCYEIENHSKKDQILLLIKNRSEKFDKTYSRFRKDSLISGISEKKGEYVFPKGDKRFFDFYEKLYKVTHGKFTLLIGKALNEAGYDSKYSLKSKKLHKIPENEEIFTYKHPKLTVKKPFTLDFGGLGKGYLIDIISEILISEGIVSFSIDAGGDIFYRNLNGGHLRVGLENPLDFKQVIGIYEIINESICSSSGSRRKWGNFHHIIDPTTLVSPQNILATWAIAENAVTADAMSTCLFLTNPQTLQRHFSFEYLILYPDFTINKSEGFTGELFFK